MTNGSLIIPTLTSSSLSRLKLVMGSFKLFSLFHFSTLADLAGPLGKPLRTEDQNVYVFLQLESNAVTSTFRDWGATVSVSDGNLGEILMHCLSLWKPKTLNRCAVPAGLDRELLLLAWEVLLLNVFLLIMHNDKLCYKVSTCVNNGFLS